MGDSLRDFVHPCYLTAEQSEIYDMALEDKAFTQVQKALEAYQRAVGEKADSSAGAKAQALSDQLSKLELETIAAQAQAEANGRAAESQVRSRHAALKTLLDGCGDLIADEAMLGEYLAVLATPAAGDLVQRQYLADSLRLAAFRKLQTAAR